jgi:hypothetical protein
LAAGGELKELEELELELEELELVRAGTDAVFAAPVPA